jgi:hypothetical protein
MRVVFGVGSRLFFWETSLKKVHMSVNGGSEDEAEEFEQAPPMDPHGTLSSHMEISPTAVYGSAKAERKFGFGSEKPGGEEG